MNLWRLFVIAAASWAISCGASSTGAPASAETADSPAEQEPGDTAFGDEEGAPEPESQGEEAAPAAAEEAGEEAAEADDEPLPEEPAADPNAPPPSADLNAYVGTGGQTPEYKTVTANLDLIKRCYLDALRKNADLQGSMRVQFTVNKKGKIIKAKAIENELTPEVAKCVVNTMKKLKFPARADKRTVEYPFKFYPTPTD
jgi:TonB family protein